MRPRTLPTSLTDTLRPTGNVELVRQLADELAESMRLIHGGAWRILIDHEVHFVVVRMQ